ncbi:unnamed protein product [Pleuronectes platessa]|uniref:Uncharacterized protein n=1 Tax=Pleuronectes platessa TaxID=8262 RepID=A0A9N7W3X9_PLEPL|nr:unnamed protein product [Pleuronectes platessa]
MDASVPSIPARDLRRVKERTDSVVRCLRAPPTLHPGKGEFLFTVYNTREEGSVKVSCSRGHADFLLHHQELIFIYSPGARAPKARETLNMIEWVELNKPDRNCCVHTEYFTERKGVLSGSVRGFGCHQTAAKTGNHLRVGEQSQSSIYSGLWRKVRCTSGLCTSLASLTSPSSLTSLTSLTSLSLTFYLSI